jgi:lipopolysaccharide biosynthesis regulator YciM
MNSVWSLPSEWLSVFTLILVIVLGGVLIALVVRRRRADRLQRCADERAALGTQPFQRGFDLLLDGRWRDAAAVLKEAVQSDPRRMCEYLELGKLFRRQGEPSRAARMFEQLLARPGLNRAVCIVARYELALAYQALGWPEAAATTLERLLGTDPSHAEGRRALRWIHEETGQWETAVALEILRLQRGEATDRRTLAALLTQQGKAAWVAGNLRDSATHLHSALAADPDCLEAALYLGRILLRQGKVPQAFQVWDGMAKARPELLFLAFRDIQSAFQAQQNDTGWETFLRAFTEHHPHDATGYLALAECYEAQGRIEDAVHCLRCILELDPLCREAHVALVSLYRMQGMPGEVLDSYARLAGVTPQACGDFHCSVCGHPKDEAFGKCSHCRTWATSERRIPPASRPSSMSLGGASAPSLSPSTASASTSVLMRREPPTHPSPAV